ncbi:n2227-like protein [Cooperia oncophora]
MLAVVAAICATPLKFAEEVRPVIVAREDGTCNENDVDAEIREAEKILNAFLCYGMHGREMACRTMMSFKKLSPTHKNIILQSHNDHMRKDFEKDCDLRAECFWRRVCNKNQENSSKTVVNQVPTLPLKALTDLWPFRRPDPHYMSKVLSTLRQIVREWTVEGKPERDATYKPLFDLIRERYPSTSERRIIRIMVPGSGLGRLAYELAKEGFTIEGNEYSMVMLMTSSFLLNACFEAEEHVMFPYALDKSNCWSYEDQTRPVYFPDIGKSRTEAPPNFSMIAGDFLEITQSRTSQFDCVVTAWFIDTAKNIIDYIETIYKILKPGGIWLNVGPLTYHYEDMIEEMSIELPYEEVMRIVRLTGFVVEKEERITSYYTVNRLSMLQNQYTCAFFAASKPAIC